MQESTNFFNFAKFMGTVTPSGIDFHRLAVRAMLYMPFLILPILLCLIMFPETTAAASSRRRILCSQNKFFPVCLQAANAGEARVFLAELWLHVRMYEQASLLQGYSLPNYMVHFILMVSLGNKNAGPFCLWRWKLNFRQSLHLAYWQHCFICVSK